MRNFIILFCFVFFGSSLLGQDGIHDPTTSIGYIDGTHARSYTANPNYLQDASSLSAGDSNIHSDQPADVYINFLYDTGGKSVYCVYTTDGTEPTKSNGNTVSLSFSKYFDPNRFWYGTIPSIGSSGTTVKYIFYISDGTLDNAWGRISSGSTNGTTYETSWTEGSQTSYSFTTIAALPVELSTFKATQTSNAIALNWTTLSEDNNAGFDIEHSVNGKDFEAIGYVEGAGNSMEQVDYSYLDENPTVGVNYYRLKQTDFDGTYDYSNIIAVEFDAKIEASIYPNPTSEQLTLRAAIQDMVNIRVVNINGQVVLQQSQYIDNQLDLNLNELPTGTYWLQVTNETNKVTLYNDVFVKE